ncbi:plasmid pRiA4b ORF-3 family protein [Lentzea tibetensis]|uniref:plasmid pRiA4b ORF-3 family protein n=1 Tax=Lentzea tibetensis TaxID=2591470 RepID=UPI0016484929|nr:plasmid pRiA4b ORF-3 family protein [Lentzea tibetensis]
MFVRLRMLAGWIGTGRRVTARAVLRPVDVPQAAYALGIGVPQRIRSAAELPELHAPWTAALALGIVRIHDGTAILGRERALDTEDWLTSLAAVTGAYFDDEEGEEAVEATRGTLGKLLEGAPACRFDPALLDLLADFGVVDERGKPTDLARTAVDRLQPHPAVDLVPAQRICRLRVTLRYVRPSCWRRILVPATFTLGYVHQIVQVAMSWDAASPHLFTVGRRQFDATVHDELSIGEAFTVARRTIVYDFGPEYRHEITLEGTEETLPDRRYPLCVASAAPCDLDEVNRELAWLTREPESEIDHGVALRRSG